MKIKPIPEKRMNRLEAAKYLKISPVEISLFALILPDGRYREFWINEKTGNIAICRYMRKPRKSWKSWKPDRLEFLQVL